MASVEKSLGEVTVNSLYCTEEVFQGGCAGPRVTGMEDFGVQGFRERNENLEILRNLL